MTQSIVMTVLRAIIWAKTWVAIKRLSDATIEEVNVWVAIPLSYTNLPKKLAICLGVSSTTNRAVLNVWLPSNFPKSSVSLIIVLRTWRMAALNAWMALC